jgi:tetratricopeptide (TPR) repeat protein
MRRGIARALIIPLLLAVALLSGCQSKSDKLVYQANEIAKKATQVGPKEEMQLLEPARAKLLEAIKLDPKNLNAYKLLGQIDDITGNSDEALKIWMKASELDPTNREILQHARMYQARQQMIDNAKSAVDQIKNGDVAGGMRSLKDALQATKTPQTRGKVIDILKAAIPEITKVGDQQVQDKKYTDAIKTYDQAIRGYMLLAVATKAQSLDPAANAVIHSANQAAKEAGTPDATFGLLNDVLSVDPSNKTGNMELAQVYLSRKPPDYSTAADLEERAGAPDADVKKLRDEAKRQERRSRR